MQFTVLNQLVLPNFVEVWKLAVRCKEYEEQGWEAVLSY